MRTINETVLFLSILLIHSCTTNHNESIENNFLQTYEGKIGKYPILIKLEVKKNVISGNYFYAGTGGELRLSGTIINNDSLFFQEREKNKIGEITGNFSGKISEDKREIKGVWYNDKKDTLDLVLSSSDLDYQTQLDELKASKVKIINLIRFEGINSLPPYSILNKAANKTSFAIDYAQDQQKLEKIIFIMSIGSENIRRLNEEINNTLNTIEDIAGSLSPLDKRLEALYNVLKNIDGQKFFNEEDGTNSRLNTFFSCKGKSSSWRTSGIISHFLLYDNKTSGFKIELDRTELPPNGFDICVENPNSNPMAPAVKFELRVIGVFKKKKTFTTQFSNICQ